MIKTSSKIISIIFGVIAIYFTVQLIPDKSQRTLTALNKEYSFIEKINVSEKFITDFESSYGVHMKLMNSTHKGTVDTILPIEIELKILENGKPIELYGDYENGYLMDNGNAQLSSFLTKENTEYELKLNIKDNNPEKKKIKINIAVDVPAPSYDLMTEKDFKWVFWTIDGIIILITLIAGYFGFRKKPAGNTV